MLLNCSEMLIFGKNWTTIKYVSWAPSKSLPCCRQLPSERNPMPFQPGDSIGPSTLSARRLVADCAFNCDQSKLASTLGPLASSKCGESVLQLLLQHFTTPWRSTFEHSRQHQEDSTLSLGQDPRAMLVAWWSNARHPKWSSDKFMNWLHQWNSDLQNVTHNDLIHVLQTSVMLWLLQFWDLDHPLHCSRWETPEHCDHHPFLFGFRDNPRPPLLSLLTPPESTPTPVFKQVERVLPPSDSSSTESSTDMSTTNWIPCHNLPPTLILDSRSSWGPTVCHVTPEQQGRDLVRIHKVSPNAFTCVCWINGARFARLPLLASLARFLNSPN